jgi:hypothetical protein
LGSVNCLAVLLEQHPQLGQSAAAAAAVAMCIPTASGMCWSKLLLACPHRQQSAPAAPSATGACSRDEPQPKFCPPMMTLYFVFISPSSTNLQQQQQQQQQ